MSEGLVRPSLLRQLSDRTVTRPCVKFFPLTYAQFTVVVGRLARKRGTVLLGVSAPDGYGRRYTVLGTDPFQSILVRGDVCRCTQYTSTGMVNVGCIKGNPWATIKSILDRFIVSDSEEAPEVPSGGCIGYWGYELADFAEPKLHIYRPSDIDLPDCYLFLYDSLLVYDHAAGRAFGISSGVRPDGSISRYFAQRRVDWWERLISESLEDQLGLKANGNSGDFSNLPIECRSSMTRQEFLRAVERARNYMREGYIYQVNLSHRLAVEGDIDAWQLYQVLIENAGEVLGGFCNFGDFQLVSASPELFLRIYKRGIVTRPIKGTKPRGKTEALDAQFFQELRVSEKEKSELLMITDLMRNDLGRICEFGSVRVPELFVIEAYSYVYHQVSTVTGVLRPGLSHLDVLEVCFPGGSVTGAPKVKAMQIIRELEPVPRGPYTGALGIIGFSESSHLSMVIRTAICCRGKVYYNVGSGIVIDSDPGVEYEETMVKARCFLNSLLRKGLRAKVAD